MTPRQRWRNRLSVALLAVLVSASPVLAQSIPSGAVDLDSADLYQSRSSGKTYTCGRLPPWAPGRLVQGWFYPTKTEIVALKRQIKAATSSAAKSRLESKLTRAKATLTAGKRVCTGSPQPTPTPDTGGGAMYDRLGNMTAAGKAAFGVPSNLSASVNSGIGVWNNTCKGCHQTSPMALSIKTFPLIRARIQLSPMSFSIPAEVTEQMIADVVAFANYQ